MSEEEKEKATKNIIDFILSGNLGLAMILVKSLNLEGDIIKRINFRISIKDSLIQNHFKNTDALKRCLSLFESDYTQIAEPLDHDSVNEMICLEKEKINKVSMEKDSLTYFIDELLKSTKKEDQ